MKDPEISDEEIKKLSDYPVWMNDTPEWRIQEYHDHIRQLRRELIVIRTRMKDTERMTDAEATLYVSMLSQEWAIAKYMALCVYKPIRKGGWEQREIDLIIKKVDSATLPPPTFKEDKIDLNIFIKRKKGKNDS